MLPPRWLSFSLSLILAFCLAVSPVYADRCDRIARKIAKSFEQGASDDDIIESFPRRVQISIDKKVAHQALVASIRVWEREFDPKRTKEILKEIVDGEKVSKKDRKFLKDQRKKGVFLRSLLPIFGKDSPYIDAFYGFVKDLGKLNDGIEKEDGKFTRKRAAQILDTLPEAKKMDLESEMEPAKVEKVVNRLRNERRRLRTKLQKPEMTAEEYHKVRKEMRDFLHLLRVLNEVTPDDKFTKAFRLAETISDSLDEAHRKVALETLGDKETYEKERMSVKRDLHEQITEFLDALWFHDAS